jgi:hypothetical protein
MTMRPLTEVVEALEQKHSEDQESIADNLVLALFPLGWMLDFEDLDRSSVMYAEAALPAIRTAYLQSQHVAAAFAANVRYASLATATPMLLVVPNVEVPVGVPLDRFELPSLGDVVPDGAVAFDEFPEDDVRLSLLVEGNYHIKQQMPVANATEAMANARVNLTGAAVRQSLKGARNVTSQILKFDRKVLGYARFTDANPCHFCALLASRGAVYGRHSFVDSDAGFVANKKAVEVPPDYLRISKVHNNCRCTLRPVYSKATEFDADAKFYRNQWKTIFDEHGHKAPEEIVKEWRENFTPYERKPADVAKLSDALRERESALLAEGFDPNSPQVRWAQSASSLLA